MYISTAIKSPLGLLFSRLDETFTPFVYMLFILCYFLWLVVFYYVFIFLLMFYQLLRVGIPNGWIEIVKINNISTNNVKEMQS